MAPNNKHPLLSFELTTKHNDADHRYHYSEEMLQKMRETHYETLKAKPRYLPKLLKLAEKHARIPAFQNYLMVYYYRRNKPDKAFALSQKIVKQFPDYLHGIVNLAQGYIAKEQFEKALDLLGESLDLQALYPDRKIFHFNEYEVYTAVVCEYLIKIGNFQAAEERLHELEQVLPESDKLVHLQFLLADEMGKQLEYQEIGRGYDQSIQTTDQPVLQHQELKALYEHDLSIPREKIETLLRLPRESLIDDLATILWDSVRRYAFFYEITQISIWDEQHYSFPMHALFMLTELRSEDQLPLLLDCLRQGDAYLEFWYSEHTTETWWTFIYHLGQDQLQVLQDFMQESNIHYSGKGIISEAVKQIGLHQPDRITEILDWYENILRFFLESVDDTLLIDPETIAPIVYDISALPNGDRLLPLIKKFYELDLVDIDYTGTYENFETYILNDDKGSLEKQDLHANLFDHYDDIVSNWYGNPFEEDLDHPLPTYQQELAREGLENIGMTAPKFPALPKVGRNDPCPCGSGKKYKKCCLKKV